VLDIAAEARSDSPSSSESAGCQICFLSTAEGLFGLNNDDWTVVYDDDLSRANNFGAGLCV
jgi:hypothetical protein